MNLKTFQNAIMHLGTGLLCPSTWQVKSGHNTADGVDIGDGNQKSSQHQLRERSLNFHYLQGFRTIPKWLALGILNHQQYAPNIFISSRERVTYPTEREK